MCVSSVFFVRRLAALALWCACGVSSPLALAEGALDTASTSSLSTSAAPGAILPALSSQEASSPSSLASSPSAFVAPAPVAYQTKHVPGSSGHLLNVILALALIVVLVVAVGWFVRRFGQGVMGANAHMQILAAMPLGARERLLLVDVAGQQLLLGVTATQINSLHVFPEPVVVPPAAGRSSDFSRKLLSVWQQKHVSAATEAGQGKP